MESLQKFFYDLFLGINWDKGYCASETSAAKTNNKPQEIAKPNEIQVTQEPTNQDISKALLPLATTVFKRRKLNPSN
jgi:hypothetical protein